MSVAENFYQVQNAVNAACMRAGRDPSEVTELFFRERIAPEGVNVYNPAFDVVDHELITGIVTEAGIVTAPFEENFERIMGVAKNADL